MHLSIKKITFLILKLCTLSEHVAIGFVGSSDIANSLLIGALSESVIRGLGWDGYFAIVAAISAVVVLAATFAFPILKEDNNKEEDVEKEEESGVTTVKV
jgi:predicted MFS family arabinose efflux permease